MIKKILLTGVVSAIFLAGCASQNQPTIVELPTIDTTNIEQTTSLLDENQLKTNCELSLGTFENGTCLCQLENDQTQEEMYDELTGYCQSTMGGPAGPAFEAAVQAAKAAEAESQ
jgi:hypothetical protein